MQSHGSMTDGRREFAKNPRNTAVAPNGTGEMDQAQKRRRPGQSEMAKQIATGLQAQDVQRPRPQHPNCGRQLGQGPRTTIHTIRPEGQGHCPSSPNLAPRVSQQKSFFTFVKLLLRHK